MKPFHGCQKCIYSDSLKSLKQDRKLTLMLQEKLQIKQIQSNILAIKADWVIWSLFLAVQNGAFTATLREIFPFLPRDSLMKLDRRSLYVLQNVSQLTVHAGKDGISRVPTIQKIIFHLCKFQNTQAKFFREWFYFFFLHLTIYSFSNLNL